MKFVKRISLFLVYPVVMLGIGFAGGIMFIDYFYPGHAQKQFEQINNPEPLTNDWQKAALDNINAKDLDKKEPSLDNDTDEKENIDLEVVDVAMSSEKIDADTEYVLEETDIRNKSVVETVWKVPAKYIGMNREQFLASMEDYEAFPPLSELERGFVNLEVLSFSSDKVVVQMNYEYTQPSASFYLKVENNYVVVYLDDKETIYMYTEILLTELPDDLQQEIINVMFVTDEESLYDFLESYSS